MDQKPVDFNEFVTELPRPEQMAIKAAQKRYQEACRVLNLASLRAERGLSQVQIAQGLLGADLTHDAAIAALRGHVEALGGRLVLAAVFPEEDPIVLEGLEPEPSEGLRRETLGTARLPLRSPLRAIPLWRHATTEPRAERSAALFFRYRCPGRASADPFERDGAAAAAEGARRAKNLSQM